MTWLVDDLLVGIKSVSPLKCFDTVGRLIGMAFCLCRNLWLFSQNALFSNKERKNTKSG